MRLYWFYLLLKRVLDALRDIDQLSTRHLLQRSLSRTIQYAVYWISCHRYASGENNRTCTVIVYRSRSTHTSILNIAFCFSLLVKLSLWLESRSWSLKIESWFPVWQNQAIKRNKRSDRQMFAVFRTAMLRFLDIRHQFWLFDFWTTISYKKNNTVWSVMQLKREFQ